MCIRDRDICGFRLRLRRISKSTTLSVMDSVIMAVTSGITPVSYTHLSKSRVTISWKNRINPVEMDVVNPRTLLNRLLKSISGGKDGLTEVIESMGDGRLDNCMVLAAESARKIPGAKIYTSFTKFASRCV